MWKQHQIQFCEGRYLHTSPDLSSMMTFDFYSRRFTFFFLINLLYFQSFKFFWALKLDRTVQIKKSVSIIEMLWRHRATVLLYLTSDALSGPLLWFCRKRQPSLASLWTISSLDRSSLSCRMHMLLCCSVGDTENMYLRPQSHDIASSQWQADHYAKKLGLFCPCAQNKRRWAAQRSISVWMFLYVLIKLS